MATPVWPNGLLTPNVPNIQFETFFDKGLDIESLHEVSWLPNPHMGGWRLAIV
jgi:hypothetical protein